VSSGSSRTSRNRDQGCLPTKGKATNGGLLFRDMHRRIPDTLRAAAILAFVIILVYGEVCFLGYTLSPAINNSGVLSGFQYGYEGRKPYNLYVMDPLATGGTMWPVYAIISRALISGQILLSRQYSLRHTKPILGFRLVSETLARRPFLLRVLERSETEFHIITRRQPRLLPVRRIHLQPFYALDRRGRFDSSPAPERQEVL
jgi:hypothetical protein